MHYSVTEWVNDVNVQDAKHQNPKNDEVFDGIDASIILPKFSYEVDRRIPFLKINLDNLVVRQIKASTFTSQDYKVSRKTYKMSELRGSHF